MKKFAIIISFVCILFFTFHQFSLAGYAAPKNLKVTQITSRTVKISWSPTRDAKYYEIQIRNSQNKLLVKYTNLFKTQQKIGHKYLGSSQSYSVRVRFCNTQSICSPYTNPLSFRTKPAQIDSLVISSITENSSDIEIHKKPIGTINSYEFAIKKESGSYSTVSFTEQLQDLLPTLTVPNLIGSTLYTVKARAVYDSKHKGEYSPEISFTTSDPVLVGAGDIATCEKTRDEETANLLGLIPGTVFTTGDNVYDTGSTNEFANCYEPSWGRYKSRTYPSVGNHEYNTLNAQPYFDYFGSRAGEVGKGYYSYNLGKWHVIVLNSNCDAVSCSEGSQQELWLKNDLQNNATQCTVAYMHHPLFSSGPHGNNINVKPLWNTLYDANVDLVLAGHDHDYERFAAQDPDGNAVASRGIREIVVGTGGKSRYDFTDIKSNSIVRDNSTYGVLKLTLKPTSYDWQFIPITEGTFTDSGSATCH